ncbi:hypothetical protein DFH06DRAFT_590135 [Mycena polygramma]|nr:hypothetical protein DFH06DRAFT_590135 [Mycena polygramma]
MFSVDVCPVCEARYLTHPKPSQGHYSPLYRCHVYQQCLDNTFEDDTPCTGFVWCDDLSSPSWGLVMPPGMPSTPSCCPAGIPCTSRTCSPRPRALNLHCSQSFCKDCCFASSVACRIAAHNRPAHPPSTSSVPEMALYSAPGAPELFAEPFAKMIPPTYHQKNSQQRLCCHLIHPVAS